MKRRTITLYDYKNRPTDVKTPLESWWWGLRVGSNLGTNHCVISCYNESTVAYITDYGFARIAYCESHARERIMNTMLTGQLERGIWCEAWNGKLRPHDYYKRYMSDMMKAYPLKAKKLKQKLAMIK